jgi:hypothetical protein
LLLTNVLRCVRAALTVTLTVGLSDGLCANHGGAH